MKHLGIDIGTTSICGAVIAADGHSIESVTLPNRAALDGALPFARIQDPERIVENVLSIANTLIEKHPDIASIGFSGQMHGILYTDVSGKSVSPLYTWQDARGEQIYRSGECYASYAGRLCGYKMASGYGLVTHFYNGLNRLVPDRAVTFCTIADYAVMRLCGLDRPLLHNSNAASIGCFDLKKLGFDSDALEKLTISPDFMPKVCSEAAVVGAYRSIPVTVAIGDNQASFIGSGADGDGNSILVNVGTGSQISLVSDFVDVSGSVELRPFVGGQYLLVGSSLSGGRAYALLENFFRAVAEMAGTKVDSMYPYMTRALERYKGEGLKVSTLFDGSRDDPSARGAIEGIGVGNFTPEAMMLGFLNGIADELYEMYLKMGAPAKAKLIGSGNGIRRNPQLAKSFEQRFGLPLTLSSCEEEAACGAAIFGREIITR